MKVLIAVASVVALAGCASQLYWAQDGRSLRETAADLHACRSSLPAGQRTFSAQQVEQPCMTAKGYLLSGVPPLK